MKTLKRIMGKKEKPFNNPFFDVGKALKKKLKKEKRAVTSQSPPSQTPTPANAQKSDQALFAAAVAGVVPEPVDKRGHVTPILPPTNARHVRIPDEEAETLAELASLIDGTGKFDISESDEFIEGCVEGLDRRILKRLRTGDYAIGTHLDLHGLTREDAFREVDRFIERARLGRHRCVLIVHGRGLNSKDNIPVLKKLLRKWLQRGRISRSVLAFCTAQPHDGGAGAVYVLLRR